jgi:hypothetical protein
MAAKPVKTIGDRLEDETTNRNAAANKDWAIQ